MIEDLSATQVERYGRHLMLDELGPIGQQALLDGSVLVVGAGGLGSPVLQYLAAAGVGRLGIADDDVVERSNLHRQVIHSTDDIGRPKVESAADTVRALNPDVTVECHSKRVTPENAVGLVNKYAVVVDASDNFRTRFLLNDVCVVTETPLTQGAIDRFEGQVTTITDGGPCYRCLFPEAPPEGAVADCSTAGVLGVLPGTIGAIQATEALKLLVAETDAGFGETLAGRLLVYDAATLTPETVPIEHRHDCPVCGDAAILDSPDAIRAAAYGPRYSLT